MITRKAKSKKRKNPNLEEEAKDILSQFGKNIKFKYLSKGSFAETYYFTIKDSRKLNPGEYVLKVFNDYSEDWLSSEQIDYLIKLSNYGLIPRIYYIYKTYTIMNYIRGKSLLDLRWILSRENLNLILLKVAKLLKTWHKLGFVHGDLHEGNVLITDSQKIYLIDPNLERIGFLGIQRDFRFFEVIYSAINYDVPKHINENKIRELLS